MARRGSGTVVGIAGLGALAYAVVLLAAASGPAGFVGGGVEAPGPHSSNSRLTLEQTRTITPASEAPVSHPSEALAYAAKALLWTVALVLAVCALVLLWRWVRRFRARGSATQVRQVDPSAAAPAGTLDTSKARAALREVGTARNAIVRAWLDLETAAAATGLPRREAETSSQYTQRVLAERSVTPSVICRLADLFREARFSAHPVTEEHRQEAIDAFLTLDVELRRGVLR